MTPLIVSQYGIWTLGTVGVISLIAATTNAFNGALLARRPDHYKHFTLIGVIILAYAGGIGGGIARDILVNKIPSPLSNPWYLIACFAAAGIALLIDLNSAQRFKDGLFQFMTAFSLPWYAIVGAQAALDAHLGYIAAVVSASSPRRPDAGSSMSRARSSRNNWFEENFSFWLQH